MDRKRLTGLTIRDYPNEYEIKQKANCKFCINEGTLEFNTVHDAIIFLENTQKIKILPLPDFTEKIPKLGVESEPLEYVRPLIK